MKLNFKNLLIIFLVALLGGFAGTMGANEIKKQNTPNETIVSGEGVTHTTKEVSNLKDAISKAYDTVVKIQATTTTLDFFNRESSSTSAGSGVILSSDGYIVTNHHVIENANEVMVITSDDKVYQASLVGTDSKTDVAVIKIEAKDLPYATFANSDTVEIGDDAIAIGNALGSGISVTNGIVSALHKEVTLNRETMNLLQTNAEINSGNSGGGLFNINGELIGIVNSKTSTTMMSQTTVEGLGYAIPANTVVNIVNSLIKDGYVKDRATLGITISEITQNISGFDQGLYIVEIQENGAAHKAGLEQYDRIIRVDDYVISSYNDLSSALKNYAVGDKVKITVIRNDKEMTFDVILQENRIQENK